MIKKISSLFLFTIIIVISVTHGKQRKLPTAFHYEVSGSVDDWWTSAVFYQIYPRSFQDSDGDGNGDLNGIISRLEHLKDAGVTGAWLSPVLKSPQMDQGYDISDYYTIDPLYGTVADFRELVVKARELDLKIIMDLVPNHTSDKHEWFQLSINRTAGYEDFYVWHDGVTDENNQSLIHPPNNWISNFSGSAWTWNEQRKQFYYHAFEHRQPDLNYANPKVVEAMKNVMRFWLDQGIDGFRVDAVPYLMEDPDFKDEPLAEGYKEYDVNNFNSIDHKYTLDLDTTFDLIYQFRDVLDEYTVKHNTCTKIMMTEAYSPINKTMLYYGSEDGSRQGGHFTFNFNFITYLKNQKFNVDDIIYAIDLWMSNIPKNHTSNWVLGNHDNHRVASRFGKENIDAFNMLLAFLPGIMVTYNGEEIGMENGEVTCEEGYDPQAIKNCSIFNETSRDFERTPYQWDSTNNAGFSTSNKTWLPVSTKYLETNLVSEKKKGRTSHYGIYKSLLKFRRLFAKNDILDTLTVAKIRKNVLQVLRTRGKAEYIYLCNFSDEQLHVSFWKIAQLYEVVVASRGSSYRVGETVEHVTLNGHESLILRSIASHDR